MAVSESQPAPSQNMAFPSSSVIQILERRWLSPKNTLYLVRVDQQCFLLSQTPMGASWQKLDPLDPKLLTPFDSSANNPSPPKPS